MHAEEVKWMIWELKTEILAKDDYYGMNDCAPKCI